MSHNEFVSKKVHKTKQSSFLLQLSALVLFLAIFTGFTLLNKENTPVEVQEEQVDISNWETYVNSTYGYEIKYPNDFKILPTTSKDTTCITLIDTQQCVILIRYWEGSFKDIKLKNLANKGPAEDYSTPNFEGKRYAYQIGDVVSKTFQVEMLIPKPNSKTGGVVTISYLNYPEDIETSRISEKVSSTFKFTD